MNTAIDDLVEMGLIKPPSPNGNEKHTDSTPVDAAPPEPAERQTERLTDLGNAYRFVRLHGQDFRYTAGRCWLWWDGKRWQRDTVGAVQRAAKETVVALYTEAAESAASEAKYRELAAKPGLTDDQRENLSKLAEDQARLTKMLTKWAHDSQSKGRIEALIALAASELPIATTDEIFDLQHMLFNCANGTVDLKTAELGCNLRYNHLTTLSPTPYNPTATAPTWLIFLNRIFANNDNLIRFVQRAVGYSLTGNVGGQVLFFCYGSGANGKSTMLGTLSQVLGRDYSAQAAPDLLLAKTGDRHPTEIADLQGKRFVMMHEVEDGRRMAEGLVKQLTGGDLIKARFMRGDFFDFWPTHKLWMSANHKPEVRGTDYAIWRRILMIPFVVTIPPEERDPNLIHKLLAEADGILAWCVQGCMEWQRIGLQPPPEVLAAVEEYRNEQDTLGAFLRECTVNVADARTKAGTLYVAYQKWCESSGVKPINGKAFGMSIRERGIQKEESRNVVFYVGIGIVDSEN